MVSPPVAASGGAKSGDEVLMAFHRVGRLRRGTFVIPPLQFSFVWRIPLLLLMVTQGGDE
jgi:hypothetical protein